MEIPVALWCDRLFTRNDKTARWSNAARIHHLLHARDICQFAHVPIHLLSARLKICLPVSKLRSIDHPVMYGKLIRYRYKYLRAYIVTFPGNVTLNETSNMYITTRFLALVQPPSCHEVEHSRADVSIKRLHYASSFFTRRQYKRASISRKLRQRSWSGGERKGKGGGVRTEEKFLSSRWSLRDAFSPSCDLKARSCVSRRGRRFPIMSPRTELIMRDVNSGRTTGPAEEQFR